MIPRRKPDARLSRDPRNADYPYRATGATRRKRLWGEGVCLDQWMLAGCVGFAWTGMLLTDPVPPTKQPTRRQGNRFARVVYNRALKVDSWPGEDKDEGTDTNAGAKVLRSLGLIEGYQWCETVDDITDALVTTGPVILSVPWYQGMNNANNGKVRVPTTADGKLTGYHCLLLTGYDPDRDGVESFRWRNSWGPHYGEGGSAWISGEDLRRLFYYKWPRFGEEAIGDACVAIGRKPATIPAKSRRR